MYSNYTGKIKNLGGAENFKSSSIAHFTNKDFFLSAGAENLKGVESVYIWRMQARDTEKWLKTAFSF